MRRKRFFPLIIAAVILALSLPVAFVDKLRNQTAAFFCRCFSSPEKKLAHEEVLRRQIERLKNQNRLLKEKMVHLALQLKESELFSKEHENLGHMELVRRRDELRRLVSLSHDGVHATIIYRPVTTWNNGFWVDQGSDTNNRLAVIAIAKNSPVLFDGQLIGVVEEVTPTRSRIRLITDPNLSIAVRARRSETLLAKGELCGSPSALWARGATTLFGRGFNYDFADAEGPAQDLRSQDPALLKTGDILITSGLDGLFPAGLPVARVTDIAPLKEGDYAYSLTAEPLASLDDLHTIFILPPL